ncbi:SGNH/GDSL hydrolase family protein [Pseudalkalibacillus sp. R45]|uniref:SGNH/GDSL hydrolase family protein n=1 Tax=Pseudalkalibacillus sp. R45 TaxID=3457433 RepID=UPI003FCD0945
MKKILYILTIILSIMTIIFGHIHWNSKINETIANAKANAESIVEEQTNDDPREDEFSQDIEELTKNLSDETRELITNAIESGTEIEVAVIGSEAIGMGETPWPELMQAGLDEAYGEGIFNITPHDFGKELSVDAIDLEKMTEVIDTKPDMVLLEPFLMNDNEKVEIEHTIEAIKILDSRFTKSNNDIVFMLQPSHPIFNPKTYAGQVEGVKNFAEEEEITYLHHWDNWPDVTDNEVIEYIQNDFSGPNDQGNEVWAEYLVNYFIGK